MTNRISTLLCGRLPRSPAVYKLGLERLPCAPTCMASEHWRNGGLGPVGIGSNPIFFCPRARRPSGAPVTLGYDSYGYNVSGIIGSEGGRSGPSRGPPG